MNGWKSNQPFIVDQPGFPHKYRRAKAVIDEIDVVHAQA
jgi:hypothetical protein